jgi:hypothetical protein
MKSIKKYCLLLLIAFLLFQQNAFSQQPKLFLVNANTAATAKKNASFEYVKQLTKQADKWVNKKYGSVMDKKFVPPCGNMHEYMSRARYYWPDPTKPDGLPYIKKDGEKNPDNDLISDDKNFDDLIDAVSDLSWTYYFTDEERYAKKATELIRFWFLDTATKMLPNLNHAQVRTGIDTGVSTGIIDTHNLPKVLDAVGLLRSSKYWKVADEAGTKQWFKEYLNWLLTSDHGKKERKAKNNHGTFYDMQVASIALFVGDNKVADEILQNDFARLAWQIEIDGKQPLELERTAALSYSTFNLEAWMMLANIAETKGVDLWHFETKDGRSIKKAIDFLIPYVIEGKPWTYKQINPYKKQDFYRLLLIAAVKFNDYSYKKKAEKIDEPKKNILTKLFYGR